MKFSKCQNLNSLFREIHFLKLPKYARNLQMLSIKFKNRKILLKNSLKIGTLFRRQVEKLARQIESQGRLWHVGTPS